MRRLSRLLRLLLQLGHLRFGLLERNVLHQHRLRQNVERILVRTKRAVQQRFCVGVLFLKLCLAYPLYERVEELFFLGSQRFNLRRLANCGYRPPLVNETRSCRQSCAALQQYARCSSLVPSRL